MIVLTRRTSVPAFGSGCPGAMATTRVQFECTSPRIVCTLARIELGPSVEEIFGLIATVW